ncbi:modifier of mdg4-like [Anthonomus grandis grandis]|uniref:modifier of mdg4-like n=1 Tax=Anthonomus grandis grandis TaxID=2921223 RepID=UPI0021659546|nr:modifier of mdg4-like [Anthonomus grandis grandis]
MSSKHFCLKWTKFQTSILNAFESLQSSEDLADVTLTCEGISVRAHKFILSACSPYFRTIFKENPCSHPIVILKDVQYVDLIAIVNFMYHGEVMVAEEQLPSFLQTATILQVSGLINNESPYSMNKQVTPMKKQKQIVSESQECPCPIKKLRTSPKAHCRNISEEIGKKSEPDRVKYEKQEAPEDIKEQNITTKLNDEKPDNQMQSSILEQALEVKTGSILERSLTSQPTSDVLIPKTIFIPRKPPESDMERLILRSSSESSSSPSTFERPSDYLHQSIKVEGVEPPDIEILSSEEAALNFSKTMIDIPHHSSQCGNCPHCGKIYSNQSALKYHVRLVHSDLTNMYCCHLCPESFDYREGYKKHMAEAHSVRN